MAEAKRILIIEDDPALADISSSMLKIYGFDSIFAENGESAVVLLNKDKYDLILLDLTLPDISGAEVYEKAISGKPEYKQKVIFTSGYHATEEIGDYLRDDKQAFLQKPFALDSIKEALQKVGY